MREVLSFHQFQLFERLLQKSKAASPISLIFGEISKLSIDKKLKALSPIIRIFEDFCKSKKHIRQFELFLTELKFFNCRIRKWIFLKNTKLRLFINFNILNLSIIFIKDGILAFTKIHFSLQRQEFHILFNLNQYCTGWTFHIIELVK